MSERTASPVNLGDSQELTAISEKPKQSATRVLRLQDFAKSEAPWVETMCDVIADNAGLLATGRDASFQNKVHLALNPVEKAGDRKTEVQD